MTFKVPSSPVCVAVACGGVALIFQIVAVAGTGWLVYDDGENGLFRYCVSGDCVEISNDRTEDWWKAVQAFSILALWTILGSLVLGILHFFMEETDQISSAGIALCSFSAIFLIIELAVFGAKAAALGFTEYGYGFILSIITCVLNVIAAVLFGVGILSTTEWNLSQKPAANLQVSDRKPRLHLK